jgi:hypothetical protein
MSPSEDDKKRPRPGSRYNFDRLSSGNFTRDWSFSDRLLIGGKALTRNRQTKTLNKGMRLRPCGNARRPANAAKNRIRPAVGGQQLSSVC